MSEEKKRTATEVTLPSGRVIVLAELTCSEVVTAIKASGKDANELEARLECVRASLRQVDGREVTYLDVAGALVKRHLPRFRDRNQAGLAWNLLHAPTEEQVDACRASVAVGESEEGETWAVTLPDGRAVVLAEPDEATVGECMRNARAEAKGAGAQNLLATIDGLRRSVRSVDGRGVSREDLSGARWDRAFSVQETTLLGQIWEEMQVGTRQELEALGEAIRAGGTR